MDFQRHVAAHESECNASQHTQSAVLLFPRKLITTDLNATHAGIGTGHVTGS
jgi:hypothetical protein